jgi:hypothetical protein
MGAFASRQCLKGNFCNSTSTANRVVWGSSEEPCPLGTYCPTGTVSPLSCADGATCTVPASPELVISNNGVLEKRESELLKITSYNISLSVKPSGSVNVRVTKEELGQVDCVQYKDGLILNEAMYVFDPSNWNVPQKVPFPNCGSSCFTFPFLSAGYGVPVLTLTLTLTLTLG